MKFLFIFERIAIKLYKKSHITIVINFKLFKIGFKQSSNNIVYLIKKICI